MSEENITQAPGLVLPDDATMAERVSATDRLLSFDAGGNPVTATASQLREYAAAGLATTEAMTAALAGKQNTTSDPGAGYDLNNLHTTGTYNVINAQNSPVAGWIYVDVIKFTAGAGWVSQFVYTLGANNTANRMFHRNGINTSEWSPWVELWHTGNLVDLWTGVEKAKARKEYVDSGGFRRTFAKVGEYWRVLAMLLLVDIIGNIFPWYSFPFASVLGTVAVIAIEFRSVIENLRAKHSAAAGIPDMISRIIHCKDAARAAELLREVKEITDTGKEGK